MKVAVVGAGWAGLAAASQCLAHGIEVTVFDASHTPGGRARAVTDLALGELDNGQHLLIGAYQQTLELIDRDLGRQHRNTRLKRLPLWLQSADGEFRLKRADTPRLPALADAWALWSAKGLSVGDKWQVSTLLWRLKQKPTPSNMGQSQPLTVPQWLHQQRQTANACRWLWHPLCIATMNTEPEMACAALFQNVLRDSLVSNKAGATDLLVPSTSLTDLWPAQIASRVATRWGQVVREIVPHEDHVTIDGSRFDACILAVPPANLARLLKPIVEFTELIETLSRFEPRSIATCYVRIEQHQRLPAPVLMFDHSKLGPDQPAQWVFDRVFLMGEEVRAQLSFVISCADNLGKRDDLELAQLLVAQLKQAWPAYRGTVLDARCFREKRATFAAVPGLIRPTTETPHRRIFLAGDWTDTGYPAVIEGAVASGIKAADLIARLSHT